MLVICARLPYSFLLRRALLRLAFGLALPGRGFGELGSFVKSISSTRVCHKYLILALEFNIGIVLPLNVSFISKLLTRILQNFNGIRMLTISYRNLQIKCRPRFHVLKMLSFTRGAQIFRVRTLHSATGATRRPKQRTGPCFFVCWNFRRSTPSTRRCHKYFKSSSIGFQSHTAAVLYRFHVRGHRLSKLRAPAFFRLLERLEKHSKY